MTKEELIRKLCSRKFWAALALFISGCLTAAGHGDDAKTAYGLIMQGAAVLAYIIGEGLTDMARASGTDFDLLDDAEDYDAAMDENDG